MLNWYWAEDDVRASSGRRDTAITTRRVLKPMVHRISGLGHGERRRPVRFVTDFASVGAFFSTLLGTC